MKAFGTSLVNGEVTRDSKRTYGPSGSRGLNLPVIRPRSAGCVVMARASFHKLFEILKLPSPNDLWRTGLFVPDQLRENVPADLNAAEVQSLVKPSVVHCSEPTPLWTKKRPSGSYFFLISARRAWLLPQ